LIPPHIKRLCAQGAGRILLQEMLLKVLFKVKGNICVFAAGLLELL